MNDAYSHGTRTLREITRILFQHWFLLLLFVAVGTAGTYLICQRVAPTYRSEISLMFKRPLNKSPISADEGEKALEVFVKAQQQIVMSNLVLARTKVIADDPELREKWFKLSERWEEARTDQDDDLDRVQQDIDNFLSGRRDGGVAQRVDTLLRSGQEELKEFRDAVELETPGGEQIAMTESFTLQVTRQSDLEDGESYKNAMYAADILADMYMVRHQELQQELNDPALRVTQEMINDYNSGVEKSLTDYETFVQENKRDIGVLEQLLKSGTEHGVQVVLTKVRENDAQLSLDLARDKAVHDTLMKTLPATVFDPGAIEALSGAEVETILAGVSSEFLEDNVEFSEMLKTLTKLEARQAKIATQFTEESRDVRYIREQITQCRQHLLRGIVAHTRGLGASIMAREQQKAMNEELVARTAEERNAIHAKLADYAKLKAEFDIALKQLERLQQDKIDAMSNHLRAREAVTIARLDAASMPDPDRPVNPKTLIYTIIAFIVSSLLGIAMAFLADHFDHTLRSSIEAERYIGLPVLGSVKKRGRSLIVGA